MMATSKLEANRKRSKTGGRKPGTPNKKTAEVQKAVAESGITPLDYMLNLMRKEPPAGCEPGVAASYAAMAFEAAKAAAPYVHPKLSSVDLNATVNPHEEWLKNLPD